MLTFFYLQIIETTEMQRNRQNLENSEIILETDGKYGCYSKKRNTRHDWRPEGKSHVLNTYCKQCCIQLLCINIKQVNFIRDSDYRLAVTKHSIFNYVVDFLVFILHSVLILIQIMFTNKIHEIIFYTRNKNLNYDHDNILNNFIFFSALGTHYSPSN